MPIYRYASQGVNIDELLRSVPGPLVLSADGPETFVDIDAPVGSKSDLDEALAILGWVFVATAPATTPDQAFSAALYGGSNKQLGINTSTFANAREKLHIGKTSPGANDTTARCDGAVAAGVTDCSANVNYNSSSPFLCLVVGSQLDMDQFGFGNAGLYACARTGPTPGSPPTLAPFTCLSASDNGSIIPIGAAAGGRVCYFGGGGWGAPAANDHSFFTAPTYTEVPDTDILRMNVSAFGQVWIGPTGSPAGGLSNGRFVVEDSHNGIAIEQLLGSAENRFAGKTRLQGAIVEESVISPAALGAGPTANYAPASLSTARIIRQDMSAAGTVSGLVAQQTGRKIVLMNISTNVLFTLTLTNQDVASTAANRFILQGLAAVVIPAGGSVELWYDGTTARWRMWGAGTA